MDVFARLRRSRRRGCGRPTLVAGLLIAFTALSGAPSQHAIEGSGTKNFDAPETGSFAKSSPDGHAFRLVSWNIDRGYGFDRVVETLRQKQPDLCLLQEVDLNARRTGNRDIAREMAEKLGYNYAFGTEFEELSQGSDERPAFHGQATLSRWPIVKTRVLRFDRQSSWWKPHSVIPNTAFFQRRLGGRIALATDIATGGSMVVVYNLHLESRSGGEIQGAQLDEVLADLKHYPEGTPAIIGGDLNSKYNPSSVRHYLEQQGFRSVLGEKLARTHIIIGYLDWIFYRGPWSVEEGTVVRGTHASDHDLILAELGPLHAAKQTIP
jgi:endonuclease/exonuclease/phosphatase family metal-dependent hydrolase